MVSKYDNIGSHRDQWKGWLRIGLDYSEEVHWSRILGEWSNVIGYETGSSLARVYTMAKTCLVKKLSTDEKMTKLPTWQHLFLL